MLLHITTAAPWRVALAAGSHVTPSLRTDGFIHLSRPDQVSLPANRLYAGRDDLLLLVIDPGRLDAEVRWEPGVPTDPESMRFPHLYGPLSVTAVTSVVPWRPGPDGAFAEPTDLPAPDDRLARARRFDRSLAERRAPILVDVPDGIGARDPRVRRPTSTTRSGSTAPRPPPPSPPPATSCSATPRTDGWCSTSRRPPGWAGRSTRSGSWCSPPTPRSPAPPTSPSSPSPRR